MSALNDEEKSALHRLLDDHTFKKALGLIAEAVDTPLTNSDRPAADVAYSLAYEKGVRDVPKLLRKLLVTRAPVGPVQTRQLNRS